jgi:hypothetical protein
MHVTLIDRGSTFGYQVRIGAGGAGRTEFFAVRKCGGQAKARRAALAQIAAWRAEGKADAQSRRGILQSNNTSRLPGIRFEWQTFGSGNVYAYLRVSFTDKTGRQRGSSISVERHGVKGAMEKAFDIRQRHGCARPNLPHSIRLLREFYATAPA